METRHICNLISLVENAMIDALNDNSENVAKAIKHISNTDLYGDLPVEVKNHFAFTITNYLIK
jgi:hypothetical protein